MVKVIVVGDVAGQMDLLVSQLTKMNSSKAGPFDCVFAAGRIFSDSDDKPEEIIPYAKGEKSLPLPFYFILANEFEKAAVVLPDFKAEGYELATNLTYLGHAGVKKVQGLTIAYLSGVEAATGQTLGDKLELLASGIDAEEDYTGADILLTCQWPSGWKAFLHDDIANGSSGQLSNVIASQTAADAAAIAIPRYHFAGTSNAFFARPPYLNPGHHVTRFIGLGAVSSTNSPLTKWKHGLGIEPMSTMDRNTLLAAPQGSTPNPLKSQAQSGSGEIPQNKTIATSKRSASIPVAELEAESERQSKQFFYQLPAGHNNQGRHGRGGRHQGRGRGDGGRGHREKPPEEVTSEAGVVIRPRMDCWFCLATPNVEKHLITSIGTEVYLSQPKGAISEDHQLIIPISHQSSMLAVSKDVATEIDKYKASLLRYYRSKGLGMMLIDRYVDTKHAQHSHIQAIPLSQDAVIRAEDSVQRLGARERMKFQTLKDGQDLLDTVQTKFYNYFEFYSADESDNVTRLLHIIEGRCPFQFGREVAAVLLGNPKRADWKYCALPKEQETKITERFRSQFKPFDWSLA